MERIIAGNKGKSEECIPYSSFCRGRAGEGSSRGDQSGERKRKASGPTERTPTDNFRSEGVIRGGETMYDRREYLEGESQGGFSANRRGNQDSAGEAE